MIGATRLFADRSASVQGRFWHAEAVRGAIAMARTCTRGCGCDCCAIARAVQAGLVHATVDEYGESFETGVPVRVEYVRGTRAAPRPPVGDPYQQLLEPAGRYMVHNPYPGELPLTWERGAAVFQRPLVIALNGRPSFCGRIYDENSWKAALSRAYDGLTGAALSTALVHEGYDGIVTVALRRSGEPLDTREIVDLTQWSRS